MLKCSNPDCKGFEPITISVKTLRRSGDIKLPIYYIVCKNCEIVVGISPDTPKHKN